MTTRNQTPEPPAGANPVALYEHALATFAAGVELVNQGRYQEAIAKLGEIEQLANDEPALIDRAKVYTRICENRLNPDDPQPTTTEERYLLGVLRANQGRHDEAVRLLDEALTDNPSSAPVLYARASAYALKGNAEAAVGDLRRAISIEPQIRFQAINDVDFEHLREEPAFIDIIEPTPAGA